MVNEKNDFVKPDTTIVKEKQKAGWLKAWFAVEVMAISNDIAKDAIREHVSRMCKAKNVLITEVKYSETIETGVLPEQLKKKMDKSNGKAFSTTAEITFFCKNLATLLEMVMMYGPSSIEVLEPNDIRVPVDEVQNIANIFSGILHQFAAAGAGGLVISTNKKKDN